jgi:hypothetical protein
MFIIFENELELVFADIKSQFNPFAPELSAQCTQQKASV